MLIINGIKRIDGSCSVRKKNNKSDNPSYFVTSDQALRNITSSVFQLSNLI